MWGWGGGGARLGWGKISDAEFLVSGFWFFISGFSFLTSGSWFWFLWFLVSDFSFLMPHPWLTFSYFIFHISKNYPTSGIWLLNSNFSFRKIRVQFFQCLVFWQIWPPSLLFLFLGITRDSPATQSIQTHTQTEGLITICFCITSQGRFTWKC